MGWSTELFCNIGFNRKTYNSIYEVQSDLDEINKCIQTCEMTLRDLVVSQSPAMFMDKDSDSSPHWCITKLYEDNIELLQEYYIDRYKLNLLIENWDNCHKDGLAIDPPENIHWNTAFLEGDFVNTVKNPNNNSING